MIAVVATLLMAQPGPLQTLLDGAQPGDAIAIGPGAFQEDLVLAPNVTLVGAGPSQTVIFGSVAGADGATLIGVKLDGSLSGDETGLTLSTNGAVEDVHVDGFAIGVSVTGGTVTLDALRIEGATTGVQLLGGDTTLTNSLVVFAAGDGIRVAGGQAALWNDLVVGCGFAVAGAAGIRSDDDILVRNTIVVSNAVGLSCAVPCDAGFGLVWGNSVDYGGAAIPNSDLPVDPLFRNAAEGDFVLLAGSPALDAGQSEGAPPADAVGVPRPQGDAVDIGPYEQPVEAPAGFELVISEVMANPLDEATGEYVEIANVGTAPVDLAGLVIDDGDATDALVGWLGGPTTLAPGAYAVILDPQYAGQYTLPEAAVLLTVASTATIGSGLSNSDPVALLDGEVALATYSFPFDAGNGVSVERDSPDVGDEAGNWVASPCGHSPGSQNCAALPPPPPSDLALVITEILVNPTDESTGEAVEILNVGETPVDLAGLTISDGDANDTLVAWPGGDSVLESGQHAVILDPDFANDYAIDPGSVLLTIANTTRIGDGLATTDPITLLDGAEVLSTFSHPFNPGNGVSVERKNAGAADVADSWIASICGAGNSLGTAPCEPTAPPVDLQVRLSEVMSNPLNEDQGEFVELVNLSDAPADVSSLLLSDGDAVDTLQSFEAGGSTTIPAGGYAVILDAEYGGQYTIPPSRRWAPVCRPTTRSRCCPPLARRHWIRSRPRSIRGTARAPSASTPRRPTPRRGGSPPPAARRPEPTTARLRPSRRRPRRN